MLAIRLFYTAHMMGYDGGWVDGSMAIYNDTTSGDRV